MAADRACCNALSWWPACCPGFLPRLPQGSDLAAIQHRLQGPGLPTLRGKHQQIWVGRLSLGQAASAIALC